MNDLMKPRYKVIADYPINPAPVGCLYINPSEYLIAMFEKYPHLFKKLEWFEDRQEGELPEYVSKGERIYKLSELPKGYFEMFPYLFGPATEKEYLNQLK